MTRKPIDNSIWDERNTNPSCDECYDAVERLEELIDARIDIVHTLNDPIVKRLFSRLAFFSGCIKHGDYRDA